jgi:hypothetical protein
MTLEIVNDCIGECARAGDMDIVMKRYTPQLGNLMKASFSGDLLRGALIQVFTLSQMSTAIFLSRLSLTCFDFFFFFSFSCSLIFFHVLSSTLAHPHLS